MTKLPTRQPLLSTHLLSRLAGLTGLAVVLVTPLARGVQAAEPVVVKSSPLPAEGIAGALVIVGGGSLPAAVRDRFLELAGGKKARLVIIPTASYKADHPELLTSPDFWRAQNVASVEVLHTRDPHQADDPAFVKPLTEATAVWFPGGDQSRLTAAYRGTAVEKELRKLLARGGVIGGTSAGAAIMSQVMIAGGNPSAQVAAGFGFLPGIVVDQHFQNRHRLDRLLGVLAQHPECPGLGIDEQTAVVVSGHTLTVVGNANVRVCLPPVEQQSADVQVLQSGDQADLLTLTRKALARLQSHTPKAEGSGAASSGSAMSP